MDPAAERRRILVKLALDAGCLTAATIAFIAWQVMGVGWAVWPLVAALLVAVGAQVWLFRANRGAGR